MRYYRSGHNQNQSRPRKKWNVLSSKKPQKRKFKQYEEAAAIRYANPFKPKTKRSHLPLKISILPLLFLSWAALLLFTPYFQINKIEIEGTKILKNSDLEELITSNLKRKTTIPSNNYFLVNETQISDLIKQKYSLNSLTVTKIFPDRLFVSVEEKASSAIYDNGEAYYLIDNAGTIIKFLKDTNFNEFMPDPTVSSTQKNLINTENRFIAVSTSSTSSTVAMVHIPNYKSLLSYGKYPIIYDLKKPDVNEKSTVLDPASIQGVIAFYNALERGTGVKSTYFTSKDAGAGITAYTDKSWKIVFDPKSDISRQISNLEVFLKNSHPTEYIDLRYGERIYWK